MRAPVDAAPAEPRTRAPPRPPRNDGAAWSMKVACEGRALRGVCQRRPAAAPAPGRARIRRYFAAVMIPFCPSPFSLPRAASASSRLGYGPTRTRQTVPRDVVYGSVYAG